MAICIILWMIELCETNKGNILLMHGQCVPLLHCISVVHQLLSPVTVAEDATSLTAASTMGKLTSGAPSPTSTNTPPERVAWGGERRVLIDGSLYLNRKNIVNTACQLNGPVYTIMSITLTQ